MTQPLYIAGYHQSKFGKLMGMTVPEIVSRAVTETAASIPADPAAFDVASIGATCNFTLNQQGLLAGLVAMVPGMGAKSIEAVENACASGGQAILSVAHKLLLGEGETGIAVGFEKMRDADGRMDGKLIGEVLGYFSYPAEREGKTFVFPHLFAEVMDAYMKEHRVTEKDLAAIAVQEYGNARHNPYAQMQKNDVTLEKALAIEGHQPVRRGRPAAQNARLLADHGRLRRPRPRDGEGPREARRREEGRRPPRGLRPGDGPARKGGRDVLHPCGARTAMAKAYASAGVSPQDVNVAEVHDCFTVMGAIGTEVIGKAPAGRGAAYWVEGKARPDGDCGINTSGGLIAKGHPIGATGIAMVGWAAWQLLGKAPEKLQVPNARAAATFNIGGPICASVCTVLTPAA